MEYLGIVSILSKKNMYTFFMRYLRQRRVEELLPLHQIVV